MLRERWRSVKRAMPAPVREGIRRAQRAVSYVPRRLFGTITHVETDEPAVALTFDDGPQPASTPRFLELLEARRARGTFFLLGVSAQRYPDLVARITAGGHAIGNHSWDHPSFPAIDARERRRQIRACAEALGDDHTKLFRPPYGNQTLRTRLDAWALGWKVVTWNIVGHDWTGRSAESIAERILAKLRPGSIVLLHEALFRYEHASYVSREATLAALARVLDAAGSRYRFVTVPELLCLGRPNYEFWIQPGDAGYLAQLREAPENTEESILKG